MYVYMYICMYVCIHFIYFVYNINLSIAYMLYNGHLVKADTSLTNRWNHGQTLIEKPLYSGHFYSGHLL